MNWSWLTNNIQVWIFALIMLGSFFSWIFKQVREQRAKTAAREEEVRRKEMILRTGRDPAAERAAQAVLQVGPESGEPVLTAQQSVQQAEMARRQEQLRQLRERRRQSQGQGQGQPMGQPSGPTQGPGPAPGPMTSGGPITRELWPGGPVVVLTPKTPESAPAQRPAARTAPMERAQPSMQSAGKVEARTQQRQRNTAPAQDVSRDRLQRPERTSGQSRSPVPQPQEGQRRSKQRSQQQRLGELDDTAITERNRRAASARSVDDSVTTGAGRGRAVAAEKAAAIELPTTPAEWRRAIMLNEILGKPLGMR